MRGSHFSRFYPASRTVTSQISEYKYYQESLFHQIHPTLTLCFWSLRRTLYASFRNNLKVVTIERSDPMPYITPHRTLRDLILGYLLTRVTFCSCHNSNTPKRTSLFLLILDVLFSAPTHFCTNFPANMEINVNAKFLLLW